MKIKAFLTLGITLGVAGLTQESKAEDVHIYKLYNIVNQEFLYTSNRSEYQTLSALNNVWIPEGQGFKVSTTEKKNYHPVFRYYNPIKRKHFFTQDLKEGKNLEQQGWCSEGVAFFSPTQGKTPIYRVKNSSGSYRYPADKATKDKLVSQGWSLEGIAWTQDQDSQMKEDNGFSHSGSIENAHIPEGFKAISPLPDISTFEGDNYPWGQCTWYVYNRAKQLGIHYSLTMGNGGDWQKVGGYKVTQTPQEGTAVSFSPGQAGSDITYGHVAFVEQVRSDGSILVSESNVRGLGVVSYRTFSSQEAKQFHYIHGK